MCAGTRYILLVDSLVACVSPCEISENNGAFDAHTQIFRFAFVVNFVNVDRRLY